MEQITITEDKLLQLIELYNNAVYDHKQAQKNLEAVYEKTRNNPEPIAPSIDEYNAFQKFITKVKADQEQYKQAVNQHETFIKNSRLEIMRSLPANKWLKVGKYYVGRRTNDWPSSDGELHIQTSKPTTELTHQIVN